MLAVTRICHKIGKKVNTTLHKRTIKLSLEMIICNKLNPYASRLLNLDHRITVVNVSFYVTFYIKLFIINLKWTTSSEQTMRFILQKACRRLSGPNFGCEFWFHGNMLKKDIYYHLLKTVSHKFSFEFHGKKDDSMQVIPEISNLFISQQIPTSSLNMSNEVTKDCIFVHVW